MSEEVHKLRYDRTSRSQYLIKREDSAAAYYDDGAEGTNTVHKQCVVFYETRQFGIILETTPTDWVTVDLWSQVVNCDIDTHVTNCLKLLFSCAY